MESDLQGLAGNRALPWHCPPLLPSPFPLSQTPEDVLEGEMLALQGAGVGLLGTEGECHSWDMLLLLLGDVKILGLASVLNRKLHLLPELLRSSG